MFEPAAKLWKQYSSKHASVWPRDDPRSHLSGEVQQRLEQLDLVLKHLKRALKVVEIDPEEARQKAAWVAKAVPLLKSGAITQDEYIAGFGQKSKEELREYVHACSEVRLFTEVFSWWHGVYERFSMHLQCARSRDWAGWTPNVSGRFAIY